MIKVAIAANRNLGSRDLANFQRYLIESYGPLMANQPRLRRLVQHPTMPEAYGHEYAPTFDSVSILSFDDLHSSFAVPSSASSYELQRALADDGSQLFDYSGAWPVHRDHAHVVADEVVIKDGAVDPGMVKTLVFVCRMPGLPLREFFDHWRDVHGPLASIAPGLRRYTQNHALPEAYAWGRQNYDGWAEMWFDDLESVYTAVTSPEWQTLKRDGDNTFTRSHMGMAIGFEVVQKDDQWAPRDYGVGALSNEEIVARLSGQGFRALASEPSTPSSLRAAAAAGALAVWSDEHLVTIDAARIDVRPEVS